MDSSKAAALWDRTNTIQYKMKLQRRTDADIIALFETLENKQGYIKQLIRSDIDGARLYTQYARIDNGGAE